MPARDPERRRTEILGAALELFGQQSFSGTAVPQIAKHAGCSAGALYRYWESKEALVNDLFRKAKATFFAHIPVPPDDVPAREAIGGWLAGMRTFAREHAAAFHFLERHRHDIYLDDASLALEQTEVATRVAWLERAQARGELAGSDPTLLIALLHGAFTGLMKMAAKGLIALDDATWTAAEERMWALVAPANGSAPRRRAPSPSGSSPHQRRTARKKTAKRKTAKKKTAKNKPAKRAQKGGSR